MECRRWISLVEYTLELWNQNIQQIALSTEMQGSISRTQPESKKVTFLRLKRRICIHSKAWNSSLKWIPPIKSKSSCSKYVYSTFYELKHSNEKSGNCSTLSQIEMENSKSKFLLYLLTSLRLYLSSHRKLYRQLHGLERPSS